MTGIIDYNAGNIKSVARALDALKVEYCISKSPNDLEQSERLIFPGVGDAQYAMGELKKSGFDVFLKEKAKDGFPILGICLGSQIIFDYSEEGNTNCLGLIPGTIKHFTSIKKDFPLKVPHMGWNNLHYAPNVESPLFDGINEDASFYFVHSYVIQPEDERVITAWADYEIKVPAAVARKNVMALQFHPEKSGEVGLQLLKNFVKLRKEDFLS